LFQKMRIERKCIHEILIVWFRDVKLVVSRRFIMRIV
jgi:hypothetical protein